jgi:hypothetical protein
MEYIEPKLQIIKDLTESNSGNNGKVDALLEYRDIIIIGEPGFGKSRLCEELISRYEERKYSCALFDLKTIKGDLDEYISSCIKENVGRNKVTDRKGSYFLTKGFDLTATENVVICFDALDEVEFKKLSALIKELKIFINRRKNIKFIISCRTHHIKRDDFILSEMSFSIIEIMPFELFHIIKFLKKKCGIFIDKSNAYFYEKLCKYDFRTGQRLNSTVLVVPRYLEMLAALVNKEGEEALALGRGKLFEKFIKEKLKEEGGVKSHDSYSRKISYVQRVLEYLALVLEIKRSNQISKDEFTTFMFDIDINLDSQMFLEVFFDRTILKDNGEWLEFDNTEFQEFLAAKAVLNLGKPEQVFFDLAVEKKLKSIYPSWQDVLGYAVELSEDLLLPFIRFASSADAPNVFNLIDYVSENYAKNNKKESTQIFEIIFEYHRIHKKWIKVSLTQFLPEKFDKFLEEKVKREETLNALSFEQFIIRGNIAKILGALPKDKEEVLNQWKESLLEWVRIPYSLHNNTVTQRSSVYALKNIVKIEELKNLREDYQTLDKDIQRALQNLHSQINPNHKESIKLFFLDKGTSLGGSHFDAIDSKDGFINVFNLFIESNELFDAIIPINHSNQFPSSFFDKLKKAWDEDVSDAILSFFKRINIYSFRRSKFIHSLLFLIKNVDDKFVFELLEARDIEDIKTPALWIAFSKLLNENQIDSFVKEVKNKGGEENLIRQVIMQMDIDENVKGEYLFKYAPTQSPPYKIENETNQIQKQEEERFRESKNKFLDCLEKEHLHIISNYRSNPKWYDTFLEEPQVREKFIDFVVKFSRSFTFDFKTLQSNSRTGEYICFEDAVSLLLKFDLDWAHIIGREKMIRHLFLTNQTSQIFEVLKELSSEDIECILSILNSDERKQILSDSMGLRNFVDIVKNYNIVKSSPVLEEVIKQESIDSYDFRIIVDVLLKWEVMDNSKLQVLFTKIKRSNTGEEDSNLLKKMKYLSHLLVKRQSSKAVEHFLENILDNVYPFQRRRDQEISFSVVDERVDLCRNLEYITLEKYAKNLLGLLEKSFSKLNENPFYDYFLEENIWEYIILYFKNLFKHSKSALEYIKAIKSIIKAKASPKAEQWFNYRISELEQVYLNVLSNRTQSIADSVKKFNELKVKKYIDIAYPDELFHLVKEIINNELTDWIRNGGGKIIADFKGKGKAPAKVEDFIQKIIVPLLEKFLLAKGIRTLDIVHVEPKIYREVEGISGKRVDLVINYGPIGSVMVELKRYGNPDFLTKKNRVEYKDKLKHYLYLTNCSHGVYLIFRDDVNNPVRYETFENHIKEHSILYRDTPNIEIIGIDCH